tara:strand:+ start:1474 stop:1812 length:339 start_codon:yes stop_codon:yes gene_type:complete
MASSIEDILMAKAMADAESKPDPAVAMGGGAAIGGVLGALPGIGGARGRMAGGLIGAITGGALGAGMQNMFAQSSPAGNMLARIQARGGDINSMDRLQLESVLKDIYNNPGM